MLQIGGLALDHQPRAEQVHRVLEHANGGPLHHDMMVTVEISQFDVTGALENGGSIQVAQLGITVVYNIPSEQTDVSQLDITYVSEEQGEANPVQISQLDIIVVYRGRAEDPAIRAWTYTLDGHDYYVLRLGMQETLVYDTHTGEWYTWADADADLWRAFDGTNWLGAGALQVQGSNVVVGGDGNGSLYFLDPDGDLDDHPITGGEAGPFRREITGQIVMRGYAAQPCYGVELLGSIGQASSGLGAVTLFVSDDRGASYDDCGTVEVTPGETDTRVNWLSLGSMSAPGRLFRIVDEGALKRIDSMEMR